MVVGLAVALAVAGCSSSGMDSTGGSTLPAPHTAVDRIGARMTVTGQLEGVGGPAGGHVQHWPGTIHVQGPVHMDVATDADGRFRLRLPSGRYVLTGHSPQYGDNRSACRAEHALVLTESARVRVRVLCQLR